MKQISDLIMIRLNKYIAHCGICSRRKAVDFIKQGLVKVNGVTERNPATEIKKDDIITFKEQVITPEEKLEYILLNKPKNTVCTTQDEKGRKTVIDLIQNKITTRVFPVGRLDRNTTGLLLLTNDGELANRMMHPRYEVKKLYHVFLDKDLSIKDLEKIRLGLELDDGPAPVDKADFVKDKGKNEIGIEIHIGRNRIVRRIFEHLGYKVEKLDRIIYGPLTKKDLPRGFSRHLSEKEIILLKHFNS